ncbi:MAG: hypothetical protein JW913_05195 [Chitinispirillaceae bacterium]|nr:hypothetical protein [Chitinispirillaceae bacterium]
MKQICTVTLSLLVLVLLSCNNRQNPVHARNNPDDCGGENCHNALPVIDGSIDTLWYDFDHERGNGSLKLTYAASDLNLPVDTLSSRFFIGNEAAGMREIAAISDSICILNELYPGTAYSCSLQVTDKHDTTFKVLPLKTQVLIPPLPPKPSITSNNTSISLSWKAVSGATGYNVYATESLDAPFEFYELVPQLPSGVGATIARTYIFNKPVSRFYIVTSMNQSGECRSRDTLHGVIFSTSVAVPVIDSVSRGTYPDHIKVSWHVNDGSISHFEIYRSAPDTGSYRVIARVAAVTEENTYRDSVTTSENCYYKIAAIDSQGYSSRLSAAASGFIIRLSTPTTLTIESSTGYIGLYWTPVSEAKSYAIYRSTSSCTSNPVRIKTTQQFSYNDSVTSTETYYYTVATVDSLGREGAKSNCEPGSLGLLPAPGGIKILNTLYPNTITISWDSLPGAVSYVIFRKLKSCPTVAEQYVTTKSRVFNDTAINSSSTYYYSVAAIDKGGRTGSMSACSPGSIKLLSSTDLSVTYGVYADYILLKWNAITGAQKYNVYRATQSFCQNAIKIASVTDLSYIDSVPTTGVFYYKVAGVDNTGIEGSPSSCIEGRVKLLPAPQNLQASIGTYANAIRLTWNGVNGATSYVIYRGTSSSSASATVIDTVTSPGYFDSVTTTAMLYYWVAGVNRLGPGTRSSYAYGYILTPPSLVVSSRWTNGLTLYWTFKGTAAKAYICRSATTDNLVRIDSVSGSSSSYNDNPPDFGNYYYRVDLRMSTGEIVSSNTVLDHKQLPPPDSLSATDLASGVLLKWNRVPGAAGYMLYRSETSSGSIIYQEKLTDTSFFDNLTVTTRYYYRVAAYNSVQISTPSYYVIGGILQAPAKPYRVYATGTSDSIMVQWSVSSGSSTPTGFFISRSSSASGPFTIIDSTTERYYSDRVTDTNYFYYKIQAYNSRGYSAWSDAAAGRLQLVDPPTPSSISLAYYSNYVRITWEPITSATEYSVYRSLTSYTDFEKICSTADTIFFDSTAVPNLRYFYRLTSTLNSIEGRQSNSFSGMRLGPPEYLYINPSVTGIQVRWQPSTTMYSVRMYYIYRSTSATGAFTKIDSVAGSTSMMYYFDTNDVAGNNYYRISAGNLDESPLSTATDAAKREFPDPPGWLSATAGTDAEKITVSWEKVYGATGYRIYRSMCDTVDYTLIDSSDTNFYVDPVPSDSFYYYRIKSYNISGESSLSYYYGRGFRIPTVVPKAPTDLDTIDDGFGFVFLTWSMPTQTIAYTGFKIYRAESEDGTYSFVDVSDIPYFEDTPPYTYPTVYWYKVTAYNQEGESAASSAVSGSRR